jgi:hypothetical protein
MMIDACEASVGSLALTWKIFSHASLRSREATPLQRLSEGISLLRLTEIRALRRLVKRWSSLWLMPSLKGTSCCLRGTRSPSGCPDVQRAEPRTLAGRMSAYRRVVCGRSNPRDCIIVFSPSHCLSCPVHYAAVICPLPLRPAGVIVYQSRNGTILGHISLLFPRPAVASLFDAASWQPHIPARRENMIRAHPPVMSISRGPQARP